MKSAGASYTNQPVNATKGAESLQHRGIHFTEL
jgi:hypothetical protein